MLTDRVSPALVLLLLLLMMMMSDAVIVISPRDTLAHFGSSVTLTCSTNITSRPVNWYCTGTCSVNTSDNAAIILLNGELTVSYEHRVSVINNVAR